MAAVIRIKQLELRIKLFLTLILAALFLILPSTTFAQTTPLPPTVSPVSPLYTDLLVHNMFHTFSCLAIGQSIIDQPCLTYLQGVPVLSKVNTSGGVLGATTNIIGMLYQNPPVRTADYLASVGEGLGIVKVANAQVVGSGAQVLNPVLSLWKVSRNIAYVLMIIIFMVIGLMVMFRNKLNPQTIITAQTALPGLVIGLIMITFSFFFAGLISDMAFVGTNVVGYYFTAALEKPPQNLAQELSGSSILNIMGSLTGIIESGDVASFSGIIFDSLGGEAQKAVRMLVFWISSQFLSPLVPGDLAAGHPLGLLIKPLVGLIGGGTAALFGISPILGQILSFAASLALVFQMFKLLLKLLMTWLTIIFLTISAPFQFLFASLPGRQGMVTGWMLSMFGNILVFPAVIAVIYFVAFLLGPKFTAVCPKDADGNCLIQVSSSNQMNNGNLISPVYADSGFDIVGTNTFPLFGGMDFSFVRILLAFGALMALPTIPEIITKTVGKAGQAGSMIGQEIMGGSRFGQGYAQRSFQSGIGTGGDIKTGIMGETQMTADGKLMFTRQGLVRRDVGPMITQTPVAQGGRLSWPWKK